MKRFLSLLILWITPLFSHEIDYDVVVVGSSPFSLLEALYQHGIGKSVLILEKSSECGGAWKSISICGVSHADMGCHFLGSDMRLLHFLEEYLGCKMVSLENPLFLYKERPEGGFYPSKGCFELISQILKLIDKTSIKLLLNHPVENISIDPIQPIATLETLDKKITTSKIIYPQFCDIQAKENTIPPAEKTKYPHIYLLISDPNPPTFTYTYSVGGGVIRLMNLTHFVGLTETNEQLIVFQSYQDFTPETPAQYLNLLKERNLVSPMAEILQSDAYIYEQMRLSSNFLKEIPNSGAIFEPLRTGAIQLLSNYLAKWEMVLKPYKEVIRD